MFVRRRDLLKFVAAAPAVVGLARLGQAAEGDQLYQFQPFGNARVLHMTVTHAQLKPVYFREPNVNIGVGPMQGKPPHLVGDRFLDYFKIANGTSSSYAFTYLDFEAAATRYGKLGGF